MAYSDGTGADSQKQPLDNEGSPKRSKYITDTDAYLFGAQAIRDALGSSASSSDGSSAAGSSYSDRDELSLPKIPSFLTKPADELSLSDFDDDEPSVGTRFNGSSTQNSAGARFASVHDIQGGVRNDSAFHRASGTAPAYSSDSSQAPAPKPYTPSRYSTSSVEATDDPFAALPSTGASYGSAFDDQYSAGIADQDLPGFAEDASYQQAAEHPLDADVYSARDGASLDEGRDDADQHQESSFSVLEGEGFDESAGAGDEVGGFEPSSAIAADFEDDGPYAYSDEDWAGDAPVDADDELDDSAGEAGEEAAELDGPAPITRDQVRAQLSPEEAANVTSQPKAYTPSSYIKLAYGEQQAFDDEPEAAVEPQAEVKHTYGGRGSHGAEKGNPFLICLAAAALIAATCFVGIHLVPAVTSLILGTNANAVPDGQEVMLNIPEGASGDDIASILSQNHIIEDPKVYYSTVTNANADSKLKPGNYKFVTGQDPEEVIAQLVEGPNVSGVIITVPEGYTQAAVAEAVGASSLNISEDDFLNQAKAANYKSDYDFLEGASDDTLEGFLFPKTYEFADDATADTVIRAMLDQFKTELETLDLSFVESKDLSVAEMVNLASIVEKESTQSTGPMVAAVFWNRLGNMGDPNYGFLQSDATTAYSVGHDPSADEVHDESDPYSTYTHQGLPPTPICNPSLKSLESVCSPDMDYISDGYYYFYFWNDENGEVQYAFSKTYDEHLKVIEEHS